LDKNEDEGERKRTRVGGNVGGAKGEYRRRCGKDKHVGEGVNTEEPICTKKGGNSTERSGNFRERKGGKVRGAGGRKKKIKWLEFR